MSNVKIFDFPTFDEWCEKDYSWQNKIGVGVCELNRTSWGEEAIGFRCRLAYNGDIIYYRCFRWDKENVGDLINWYNKARSEASKKWIEHIKATYLLG